MLFTSIIDAKEQQDVVVVDVPCAFLQADLDKDVWMALDGNLAKLMVKVSPQLYLKYVTVDKKGKKVLYVKLQKALYGLLRNAMLFYRKLATNLTRFGFKINF